MRQQNSPDWADYKSKQRFKAMLEGRQKMGQLCDLCGGPLETLHHIDEDHANNRNSNLMNVCHKCHTDIPHQHDDENSQSAGAEAYQKALKRYRKGGNIPGKTVQCRDSAVIYLPQGNYNIPMRNDKKGWRDVLVEEGSLSLFELLQSWGYYRVPREVS